MTKGDSATDASSIALKPGERPTLKTIARLSGLAVPTVSRALADAPDIRKDTKKRIREIATQIGYRPNRAGVRLRTGRTNVISLVMSTEHDALNNTSRLISAVASALRGTPYHVIITPYFPDEDPMVPIRYIVETGSADGLIINQTEPHDPRVDYMLKHNFPFVCHGRTTMEEQHAFYDYDNSGFGRLAVQALVERGRTNIAMLAPPVTQTYGNDMITGAAQAASDLGVSFSVIDGATSHSAVDEIESAVSGLMQMPSRPDALITSSIGCCVTMVAKMESLGLSLERDFDMVAKEAMTFLRRFRPGILVMAEDVDNAGDFLARALMHRIAAPHEAPMQRLVQPDACAWKMNE